MKRHLFIALSVLPLISGAATASASDPGWQARVGAAWTDIDTSYRVVADNGETTTVRGEASWGYSLSLERRLSDVLGIELGVDRAEPEIRLRVDVPGYGSISMSDGFGLWTARAGLNLHLLHDAAFDFYAGPVVGWLRPSGQLLFSAGGSGSARVSVDSGWGWGGTAGLDVGIGERWTLSGSATYLKSDLDFTERGEADGTQSLSLDPLTLRLGVGVRF